MIRRPSAQRLGEARRRRALYSGLDGAGGPAGGWLLGFPSLPWVVCFLSFFSPPFLCASPFMVRTGTYTGTPTKGIPFFIFLSASPTPQLHNPHTFAFSDGPPLRGSEAAIKQSAAGGTKASNDLRNASTCRDKKLQKTLCFFIMTAA